MENRHTAVSGPDWTWAPRCAGPSIRAAKARSASSRHPDCINRPGERKNQGEMRARPFLRGLLVTAAPSVCVSLLSACLPGGSGVPNLAKYEESPQPYYYVGRSFDGLRISNLRPYAGGVASIFYGNCTPPHDGGCPPPLELQHRLCRGRLTVVIFVGANPKTGRAARAARVLRPLSEGARGRKPLVAFGRAPVC